MTLNPSTSTRNPALDAIPTVEWQYLNVASPSFLYPGWHRLIGSLVEIRRHGQFIRTGILDNATSSGDIAWIAADGINSRTMIEKAAGYELWPVPSRLDYAEEATCKE